MTQPPEEHEQHFYQLIGKRESLTDEDLQTLRDVLSRANFNMVRPHVFGKAQLRVDVDLIDSLRKFDRASAALVSTTNRLTRRILWLTVGAIFIGLVQIPVAVMPLWSGRK